MPTAAVASILPNGSAAAMASNVCFSRMTTKCHGSFAAAEGAAMAASSNRVTVASSMSPGA
jgi:hypothetical protein